MAVSSAERIVCKAKYLEEQGETRRAWLQSRRMTSAALSQRSLIAAVFEASNTALDRLIQLVPEVDRDRAEYAVATLLLEEAWVSSR